MWTKKKKDKTDTHEERTKFHGLKGVFVFVVIVVVVVVAIVAVGYNM